MGSTQTLSYKGKSIVLADVSKSGPEEAARVFDEAIQVITKLPLKSVLLITDSTDAKYNQDTSNVTKRFSSTISPHILGSAVVGADNLKKVMVSTLRLLTKRDIRTFDTREQAMDWLVSL
ncbi:MAG: SpoIIAA family protein [Anaerolineaceae bacterium]